MRGALHPSRAQRQRPRRSRQAQRGVALIVAILLVALGTIIAATVAYENAMAARRGTGTFAFEAESGVYNELQVGSYVFMDTEYARIGNKDGGLYTAFEHSLFVLTTVISVPADDRAIVDAGLKSYSGEKGPPWVHGREDVEVTNISDEHGKLKIGPKAKRLRLGEKVWLIPGHCDPTVNLHDWYVGVRRGRVETLWPITARGAST